MIRRAFIFLLCWCLVGQQSWAACALDGFNSARGSGAGTGFTTGPISTTHNNDVIVIVAPTNLSSGGVAQVVSVSPLTWNLRGRFFGTSPNCQSGGNACYLDQEIFWAVAPTPLTNQTFLLTMNAAWQANGGFTHAHVFAFSGLQNPSSPWDQNLSLPAVSYNLNGSAVTAPRTVSGVTTSNSNDILLFGCFTNDPVNIDYCGANPSAQPWVNINTFIDSQIFIGFGNDSSADYWAVNAFQNNATLEVDTNPEATWISVADALVCVVSPRPTNARPQIWINE